MEFIDHTGHIFSLPSYSAFPTGYEYDEQPYIFWMNDENKLSIDNYYIKPIRVVLPNGILVKKESTGELNTGVTFEVLLDSKVYSLVSSCFIQKCLSDSNNIFDYINTNSYYWVENDYDTLTTVIPSGTTENYVKYNPFVQRLTENDVVTLINLKGDYNETYTMITFYVMCTYSEPSTMISNILIHLDDNGEHTYCPISVGAEFVDENEILIINGQNMGINLPKDIVKAINGTSFFNSEIDEFTYNTKIKELLLNYMNIIGECGNYKSAINALKWFGWGDKLHITKLIETDNEYINQYIIDNFDIINDTLYSYKHFRNTTYIKLFIKGNEESNIVAQQDFSLDFWGEWKPKLIDLTNKCKGVTYDENDIVFYKPYYDYLFEELGLKLSALEYFYKKYFLPIHVFIHSASISHQVFINDTKYIIGDNKAIISEVPQILYETNIISKVTFPKTNERMLYTQYHYIDENFNEFNKYISNNETYKSSEDTVLYWVNDNCIDIPIKFRQFNQQGEELDNQYYNCILILEKNNKSPYSYEYSSINSINAKDINTLLCSTHEYNKTNNIVYSHKIYKQNVSEQKLEPTDEWTEFMTFSDLVKYININYYQFLKFGQALPMLDIKIHTYELLDRITINNFNNITDNFKISIIDDIHTEIFTSNFSFVQKKDDLSTYYRSFVINPTTFGKKFDVNYWLNNNFNIYLCVNGYWHTYSFICKMPELQMDFGKLKYKYYLDATEEFTDQYGNITMFNQLKSLTDDTYKFNIFMWQPHIATVNNIDFFENLLEYNNEFNYNMLYNDKNQNIDLIEGNIQGVSDIQLNDLYYILYINNQPFYIHKDVIQQYFINGKNTSVLIPIEYLTPENKECKWILYYNDELYFDMIYNETLYENTISEYQGSSGKLNNDLETDEHILFLSEDGKTLRFNTIDNNSLGTVDTSIFDADNTDGFLLRYEDEFTERTHIMLYFELNEDNTIKFYIKNIYENNVYLSVYKTIYNNIYKLIDKYRETLNITDNDKYLNRVHLYNIYLNNSKEPLKYEKFDSFEEQYAYELEYYKKFFNQDETISEKIQIPGLEDAYNFYLMHDNEYWYALFISKLTKTNYYKNALMIQDDSKRIIYNDYNSKAYTIKDINDEIISRILFENNLNESDLLVYINNINSTDTLYLTDFRNSDLYNTYLINKIFNKNIISDIYGNYHTGFADIIWNDADSSFGIHWSSIRPDDLICPNCKHIGTLDAIESKTDGTIVYRCSDCGETFEYNNTTYILLWNETGIPYKMIYSITDDIYSDINPNGLYHLPQQAQDERFVYSMNNKLYYVDKKDVTISYELSDETDNADNRYKTLEQIKLEYNSDTNTYKLDDYIFDYDYDSHTYISVVSSDNKDRKTVYYEYKPEIDIRLCHKYTVKYVNDILYVVNITDYVITEIYNVTTDIYYKLYTDEFGNNHKLEVIQRIEQEPIYTTSINKLELYSKTFNEAIGNIDYKKDFYILYYDNQVYTGNWYLELDINKANDNSISKISDIIKIYNDNNQEVQWVVNDNSYTSNLIFYDKNGNEVNDQIFCDENNNVFTLVFDYENNIWTKNPVIRTNTLSLTDTEYILYDIIQKKYYSLNDKTVILNTEEYINNNISNKNIPNNIVIPNNYDGLYYRYDKQIGWQVLVYIPKRLLVDNNTIRWYYLLNNVEYEYTGDVHCTEEDILYNKVIVELDKPITVQLNHYEATEASDLYYDVVDKYLFKYEISEDRFLINRMECIATNGLNHFNTNDIIVSTISSKMNKDNVENKLEFKLMYGSKWIFKPMSFKMDDDSIVHSNSEMAIMSIGDNNIKYNKGYYNVICQYSIDGNTQNIYTKNARILVN